MSDAPSEYSPSRTSPTSLRGRQRALYESLQSQDQKIARIYLGSLQVLDSDNANRLPLAAHGIREILKELPLCLDVDQSAHNQSLGTKVREIEDGWNTVVSKSCCHSNGVWGGEIDSPLSRFMARLRKFFEWMETHMPRRKSEAAETLYAMDPARGRLPSPLETLNVDKWIAMRDYFVSIAHHGPETSEDDFRKWLDELERFLLDRLRPRTFDDDQEIDAVIAEGDSHD